MSLWSNTWFEGSVHNKTMRAWRGVEAQHVVSTMRLVDTASEQDLLEQLLEGSKPPIPAVASSLHYLLATPFRYRPTHAARFRKPHALGQWYGAATVFAACAEVAYWRHRFILDSAGLVNEVLLTEHTFFQGVVAGLAIDLTAQPWAKDRSAWTHGSDYSSTHAIAEAAQAQGVQWIAYESVRAPDALCAAVFDPACLSEPTGGLDATKQTWRCKADRSGVLFKRGAECGAYIGGTQP